MLRRVLLTGVILALAAGCGSTPITPSPPPPPVEPPPQPPPPPAPVYTVNVTKILAFGDSMTWGVFSAPTVRFSLDAGIPESYPFKLQTLMAARYTTQSPTVLNDGASGNRAVDDRSRFNRDLAANAPQLVLLMQGANDLNSIAGLPNTNQLVDGIVGAMEDMVREAVERRSVPVFLATLPPQRAPKGNAGSLLGRYNNGLKTMAAKKGATIVDLGLLIPDSMIGVDGLHPTEAGYQRIAEVFFDAIKEKYEAAAPTLSIAPIRP
jgi:lysophospholipase L1-like esterase